MKRAWKLLAGLAVALLGWLAVDRWRRRGVEQQALDRSVAKATETQRLKDAAEAEDASRAKALEKHDAAIARAAEERAARDARDPVDLGNQFIEEERQRRARETP